MRDLEIIERPQQIFHCEPQGKPGKNHRLCLGQLLGLPSTRRNPVVQTFRWLRCKLGGLWLR
jgi:hypothetical protein